eukprot:8519024-Alexandrium_andersonii.AAC.1
MIFLPKKASGSVPNLGDYDLPENTRPLSIVGTDDRSWPPPSSSASTTSWRNGSQRRNEVS